MRALVLTIVHHPEDSRIQHREIPALLDAGWQVTYAAPFRGYGLDPAEHRADGLQTVDVARASGRRRLGALRSARSVLKRFGPDHDVVLLHDPELLAALPVLRLPPVVWDVHEDTAAAVTLKPWLPGPLRPVVRSIFTRIERFAERRVNLVLAEYAYEERFRDQHLVVPNLNRVPDEVDLHEPRAIYVGSVTRPRGAAEIVAAARIVSAKTAGALTVTVVGPASGDVEQMLREAVAEGVLDWKGFVPSDQAMALLDGSMAGLSLLHDEPNYRVSLPTKVVEYMAHGVPVVTSPLPLAEELVNESGAGVVVPFTDGRATAEAVLELWTDDGRRHAMGAAGHRIARERFDWASHAASFVDELQRIATPGITPGR